MEKQEGSLRFVTRLQRAYRALLGRDLPKERPAVELLDMRPEDKLLICFKSRLSDETCRRLREHFDVVLKGDKRVLVMGDEVPTFFIVRGLVGSVAVKGDSLPEKKAA